MPLKLTHSVYGSDPKEDESTMIVLRPVAAEEAAS